MGGRLLKGSQINKSGVDHLRIGPETVPGAAHGRGGVGGAARPVPAARRRQFKSTRAKEDVAEGTRKEERFRGHWASGRGGGGGWLRQAPAARPYAANRIHSQTFRVLQQQGRAPSLRYKEVCVGAGWVRWQRGHARTLWPHAEHALGAC